MTVKAEWVKSSKALLLTGEVDFANVVELKNEADEWLKTCAPHASLDLSAVTYSNSAGVALIMGLRRAAQTRDKQLTLVGVPENLVSMIRFGGLDWLLNS